VRIAFRAVIPLVLAAALSGGPSHLVAQPDTTSFRVRIDRLSEEGGDFDTDNLISNEQSYLDVIPALKAAGAQGGVYIGVGPDQNFSYIAQIRPTVAFIVDIRRDNLLLHLLFKALFALAPSRVEYLSMLTGRAPPSSAGGWRDASLPRIVTYVDQAGPLGDLDGLRRRIQREIAGFNVSLAAADYSTIARFHSAFIDAGLGLKFESRGRPPRAVYPTYRDLLLATDSHGRSWNFLAADSDYQFVRSLELRNLVVPVVGDLGGTHALAAIADEMAQHGDHLSAFYISNVETYLYGSKSTQFVENVRRLPRDPRSMIIRSTFRASISRSEVQSANEFVSSAR
jgi:hypothetical protein